MTENYTLKDFTLQTLPTNALDRAEQFKKWTAQSEATEPVYWIEATSGVKPEMMIKNEKTGENQNVISFVSNDYLGLSQHPETIQAGVEALLKYGTGSCASPGLGGYLDIHKQLEKEIAAFTGQEDALVFSSGFGVNTGMLNALLGKNDIAFIDSQVHRSVLDGLLQTNIKRIGHNDLDYIERTLRKERHNYKTAMIIIDGIYSQDGDIAPLPEIVNLCKKYDTLLYMDDAHGIGVFGENGRGVAEFYNVLGQVDIITGTLSKSFGAVGGFAACSTDMVNYMKYHANTAVFSASPTPQTSGSVLKALEIIQTDKRINKKLWENVFYLKNRLLEEGFNIKQSVSPIIPVMVRDPHKVMEAIRLLKQKNIYACGVGFPAVTNKEARIRISLSASHEIEHLKTLVAALCEINKKLHITSI
ncbi:MAG: aminotransferase class I/II-fold pyridoxal phosphate-dependent enzyme [Bacteroidales bacterium]|jgi:glycine C-acetyltransferase|nr:aminotransferase class I/II-fold pyridoxal phosphate-dependent enzyme [Bacteroidales bacterium]